MCFKVLLRIVKLKGRIIGNTGQNIPAQGSGDLVEEKLAEQQFRKMLTNRINSVDMEKVKADAIRFIPDGNKFDIWSKKYFNDLSAPLKLD